MAAWHEDKRVCVYCGEPIRVRMRERRHGALYPLTCGTCSQLPNADPHYSTARGSASGNSLDKSVEDGDR